MYVLQQKLASVQQNQVELNQVLYQAQLKLAVKYLWSQVSILELEHEVAKAQLRTSKIFLMLPAYAFRQAVLLRLI